MAGLILGKKQIAETFRPRPNDTDFVQSIERQKDGEFIRQIRRLQFYFAIAVLAAMFLGFSTIVGIEVLRGYRPDLFPHGVDRFEALPSADMKMLDWAKALINTLFGAALALTHGSIYPSDRRPTD